jgi:tetratricopeptide (TPR) repeat protein
MAVEETPTEPPAQVPEQAPVEPEPEPPAEMAPPAPAEPEPEPQPEPVQPPVPPEREAYREPVTRSRSGMTGMLSSIQDPSLSQAQDELTRGNIPGAMESYGKLIKKGKLLDEIIFDLREAIYRYPMEVIILQMLGDAYMRANRLQDALDAYTKAEELLR